MTLPEAGLTNEERGEGRRPPLGIERLRPTFPKSPGALRRACGQRREAESSRALRIVRRPSQTRYTAPSH